MTKTGSERRAIRFSSNRSSSDRERIYLESFNVSVENRNWSKVGQTFSVAKEKEDERPLVEEFSAVCRPKLEEDEAKGRKSCKYFDDSVPRLPWNTAISSATAGFPQLFIEIVADADANAGTDTGFVEPQLRYLFTSLRVFASCRFLLLLPCPRLFVRIPSTDGHDRCSNLSPDTCYQLRNYAKVRAYFVRNSRQDSYATRGTRLDLQREELDCPRWNRIEMKFYGYLRKNGGFEIWNFGLGNVKNRCLCSRCFEKFRSIVGVSKSWCLEELTTTASLFFFSFPCSYRRRHDIPLLATTLDRLQRVRARVRSTTARRNSLDRFNVGIIHRIRRI